MTETRAETQRADLDILNDIERRIVRYPPSRKDQHAIRVQVQDGYVTITGHVQTPNTRRYLLDSLADVEGVRFINADQFYDDESLRLDVARVLPVGVRVAKIQYGTAILTGSLPEGQDGEALVEKVRQVPGITRVLSKFR